METMRLVSLKPQAPPKRIPRRAQRYPVRWPVKTINGLAVKDSWVVDISTLGARLETTKGLSPNCPVEFTVLLPAGDKELVLSGRVVWMRPIFTPPGRYHQGLQFYTPNWDLERLAQESQANPK
jgi:hypothetical protein|uniref:PilZ domain-containing protein n=1 Tax=Desulfobacca acetoxidans TaxID=60893 RepID=A0A7C5ANJ5_9BACT